MMMIQEEEVTKINEFRKLIDQNLEEESEQKEYLIKAKDLDNIDLLRFIRARKGNLQAALEQLLNTLKWRAAEQIDGIADHEDPKDEIYQKLTPHLV